MKPYYESGGVTIYHGDARDVLPRLDRVDILVVDPPYGMNYQSGRRMVKYDKIQGDLSLPIDIIKASIEKATRAAYVFCRWDNLRELPIPKSVLAWVKNNWGSGDLKHEHSRQWEAICFYANDKHEFIKRTPDVIRSKKTGNKLHPTQKPVDLIAKLIACNVGDIVLDSCMGVGTTLRAAKDLGRKAIGIEIEERYCEIAAKRLGQEVFDFDGGET